MRKHYEPKKVVMAERFHFHRRQQAPGETVASYAAELRRLAIHCKFEDYLDQALHDRLVCGLRNEGHQKRLPSKHELTLDKALAIAQSLEAADNAQSLRGVNPAIHVVSQPFRQGPERQQGPRYCFRCGNPDHIASTCCFGEASCL